MQTWLTPDSAPAWFQALFSVIGIGVAIWVPHNQMARQEIEARRREQQQINAARRALSSALSAELDALIAREVSTKMSENYRLIAKPLSQGGVPPAYDFFIAKQNYTAVFDANAVNLGLLPTELLTDLVTFYTDLRGLLDSMNAHSELAEADAQFQWMAMADQLANTIDEIIYRAKSISDRLKTVVSSANEK